MSLTSGSPSPEETRRVAEFADRLRAYFGGELPEGVNVNWDFAGRAIVQLPLLECERLVDTAEGYGIARQRLDGARVQRRGEGNR